MKKKTSPVRVAGRTIKEWERRSAELDKEMAGTRENAKPLSVRERRLYRSAI